ncbi:MAG: four helix bundle protein [Verrucomicrobiota bacterium]
MSAHNFENLDLWKRGCRLAVQICVQSEESKDFALRDQIRRSAISIPSNIAEGSERTTDKDFSKFLDYSKGSCGELRTQLLIHKAVCKELKKPPYEHIDEMIEETRELSSMLGGLIKRLKKPAS